MKLSIICAIGDQARFERCLAHSIEPQIRSGDEFLTEHGTDSLAATYKRLESRATNPICVFIHEDVFTPSPWLEHFRSAVVSLQSLDPTWGVLGIAGTWAEGPKDNLAAFQQSQAYLVNMRDRTPGGDLGRYRLKGTPGVLQQVQVLDSMVMAKHRGDDLVWDHRIPGFAAGIAEDICLQAETNKRAVYAVSLYAEHETVYRSQVSESFRGAQWYIVNKWPKRPLLSMAGVWGIIAELGPDGTPIGNVIQYAP